MSLVLRAATLDDVDRVLELWRETAENTDRPVDTHQAVTALLGRDPDALILAEQDGELAPLGEEALNRHDGSGWAVRPPSGRTACGKRPVRRGR